MTAAITVKDLRIQRGQTTVFAGLDLALAEGAITGLLGPSGCGKTTLMRAIVGVQQIRGGGVTVFGEPAGSRGLRSRVAYATQAASVYDDLTVAENLRYFADIVGARRGAVNDVIHQTGLDGLEGQIVATLSGGQRGRVSLAAAMVGRPDLLVLDEPTVGLDPVLRESLWALFRSLAAAGATLLVSSHVLDEAMRCDQVVLLREGTVLAHEPPGELLQRTGTDSPDAAFLALVTGSEAAA